MEHYVGLDVSLKLTAICIVDRTGKIVREGVVTSDPETIAAFIKSHAPHVARVGLTTGATSTWLWSRDAGVGEIALGLAMLKTAKRDSHIDPPASSYAIMRRARPLYVADCLANEHIC